MLLIFDTGEYVLVSVGVSPMMSMMSQCAGGAGAEFADRFFSCFLFCWFGLIWAILGFALNWPFYSVPLLGARRLRFVLWMEMKLLLLWLVNFENPASYINQSCRNIQNWMVWWQKGNISELFTFVFSKFSKKLRDFRWRGRASKTRHLDVRVKADPADSLPGANPKNRANGANVGLQGLRGGNHVRRYPLQIFQDDCQP